MAENRYRLSRNYKKLRHYLDSGLMVVCFVDYKAGDFVCRDVCKACFVPSEEKEFEHYSFSVRGIEYIRYNETSAKKYKYYPASFEEMMEKHNVEFIDFEQ